MVTKSEIVDIIELIYFIPALPLTAYIAYKHGFSREAGWLLLVILSLVRIIGASTGIAATISPSNGLIECSFIMSSIGSTLLVAALTGIVNRVNTGTGRSPFSSRQTRLLQLVGIAAVALGIVGGSDLTSSDPDTRANGHTYSKVATILILVQFLATVGIAGFTLLNSRYINTADKKLFMFALASIPFVLVRVIYSLCTAFDYNSSNFNLTSNTVAAVALRACLGVAMEIVATTLFIVGGLLAPKMQKTQSYREELTMQQQHPKYESANVHETGYQPPHTAPPHHEQGRY
ncbi:hypothetical protein H2198_005555 [Neophaeococcomyces mojaviensis]|uniref:Uncharacterized protein n=1 Tax=Neophaeococcomyces mojaviensis TaxID=3383035 RepID=A0ACC3A5M0_9EURO|nr:hypothetical protein H2198_005555 [Knufia sp. JES_112]